METNKPKKQRAKKYPLRIDLFGDRKLINLCKKEGLYTYNPRGAYNGYGYERISKHVYIQNLKELKKFNALKESIPHKEVVSEDDKIKAWINRLSKLTGIDLESAEHIANDKLEYKEQQIKMMDKRQEERYSVKRETLIRKMKRENPLRHIKNKEHAEAILIASERHNSTMYESYLSIAEDLIESGEIEPDEKKGWARQQARLERIRREE